MIGIELGKRFGGHGIGGYASWVRLTPGGSPSTHGYGAAQDWGSWPNRKACEAAMQWLIDNHQALQVQMIGDYYKKRIWKVGRTTNPDPNSWWKPYPPMPGGTWIHIETGPIGQGFDNQTPINQRLLGGREVQRIRLNGDYAILKLVGDKVEWIDNKAASDQLEPVTGPIIALDRSAFAVFHGTGRFPNPTLLARTDFASWDE